MKLPEYNSWVLPLLQAAANGKTLQCRGYLAGEWSDIDPDTSHVNFGAGKDCFRIKPETRLVPWSSPTHVPHGAIFKHRTKYNATLAKIVGMSDEGVWLTDSRAENYRAFHELAKDYQWTTDFINWYPCGTAV